MMTIHAKDASVLDYHSGLAYKPQCNRPQKLHNYCSPSPLHIKCRQSVDLNDEIGSDTRELTSHFKNTMN